MSDAPPRLGESLLRNLPAHVQRPNYDRSTVSTGIVHIGVGAFHRAHQAVYVDDVLARDPRWGISGVSMRRPDTRDVLAPQDHLYTVASRDGDGDTHRVIGSLREILVLPADGETVLRRLADRATCIVSLTVTEKGYCLDPATGRIDPSHPDIAADLDGAPVPRSLPALVVSGLRRRRDNGHAPFTLLSCDNLPNNGETARRAVLDFAGEADPELARWISDGLRSPSTMVDRIVPATQEADRASIAGTCGFTDAWPVVAEPFSQWVTEDDFPHGMPPFDSPEISLVRDVGPYEEMKLRLVNGPHSALAFVGLLSGYGTVADAMADAAIARYLERLATDELLPTTGIPVGVDPRAYITSVQSRFANAGIRHSLTQVATDGSQKVPLRLLPGARTLLENGGSANAIALALAAWIGCWQRWGSGDSRFGFADPLSDQLSDAATGNGEIADTVQEFLALEGVFQSGDAALLGPAVTRQLDRITNGSISDALAELD